jgi:rhodanese-related sulfurtransferase
MIKYSTLILSFLLAFWSCSQPDTIESLSALNMIGNDDYYFLDVRTIKEHKMKSIPNTDCIPVQEIKERMDELNNYRNKKIIVYCRSGNRSGIATKILNENGFKATNMIGGINGWKGKVQKEF